MVRRVPGGLQGSISRGNSSLWRPFRGNGGKDDFNIQEKIGPNHEPRFSYYIKEDDNNSI